MAEAPPLVLEVRIGDGVAEVTVTGDLDLTTASALADMLTMALDRHPGRLVLDLRGVRYLDCAAARVIAEAAETLPRHQLAISNPVPIVRRLLQLTGLAALIDDHHTIPEPLACGQPLGTGQAAPALACHRASHPGWRGRTVTVQGTRPVFVRVVSPPARTLRLTGLSRRQPPAADAIARHEEQLTRQVQLSRARMDGLATSIRTTAGQLASTGDRVADTFTRLAELHPDKAARLTALSAAAHEFADRSRRHAGGPG